MEPLGHHMLEKATDELMGGQGHGLPALVLGVLVAEADLADLSQISMLGLISENRLSRNQPLTASKKLINRNLRQIQPATRRQSSHRNESEPWSSQPS
jgi:hypothetical protein